MNNIRNPVVAGQFYPEDRNSLYDFLKKSITISKPHSNYDKIKGLILPHAGYPYSGLTTAKAVSLISKDKYITPTLIFLGPCHQVPSQKASIWKDGFWETPLGKVKINEELTGEIMSSATLIDDNIQTHLYEHSIEVQLPFFQYVFESDFSIIPISIGNQTPDFCRDLGLHLKQFMSDNTILIASSDLYHGYSESECVISDDMIIKAIEKYDTDNVSVILEQDRFSENPHGCGIGPVLTLLVALENVKQQSILIDRTNSAEVTGSKSGYVVGYSSFIIT